MLYFDLLMQQGKIDSIDIAAINVLTPDLLKVDGSKAGSLVDTAQSYLKVLYSIEDLLKMTRQHAEFEVRLKSREEKYKSDLALCETLKVKIKVKEFNDPLLTTYYTKITLDFLTAFEERLKQDDKAIEKVRSVLILIKKSMEPKMHKLADGAKEYVKVGNVAFDHGTIAESHLVITKFKFDPTSLQFIQDNIVLSRKINFKRFSKVRFTVNSGVFFSSVNLKGFGFSTDSLGSLRVTEDTIRKNSPATGLFLNVCIPIQPDVFEWVLQLGVDPTKQHPLLMIGTGASFLNRFGISGGLLWTFQSRLDKLSVGDKIGSSTELEDDIKTDEFHVKPSGGYIGIIVNLGKPLNEKKK